MNCLMVGTAERIGDESRPRERDRKRGDSAPDEEEGLPEGAVIRIWSEGTAACTEDESRFVRCRPTLNMVPRQCI